MFPRAPQHYVPVLRRCGSSSRPGSSGPRIPCGGRSRSIFPARPASSPCGGRPQCSGIRACSRLCSWVVWLVTLAFDQSKTRPEEMKETTKEPQGQGQRYHRSPRQTAQRGGLLLENCHDFDRCRHIMTGVVMVLTCTAMILTGVVMVLTGAVLIMTGVVMVLTCTAMILTGIVMVLRAVVLVWWPKGCCSLEGVASCVTAHSARPLSRLSAKLLPGWEY